MLSRLGFFPGWRRRIGKYFIIQSVQLNYIATASRPEMDDFVAKVANTLEQPALIRRP
jgi:hypothetical protein